MMPAEHLLPLLGAVENEVLATLLHLVIAVSITQDERGPSGCLRLFLSGCGVDHRDPVDTSAGESLELDRTPRRDYFRVARESDVPRPDDFSVLNPKPLVYPPKDREVVEDAKGQENGDHLEQDAKFHISLS